MWYDEDIYYGNKVKKLFHYKDYKAKLKRRSKWIEDNSSNLLL